ncbi:MAG: biotin--[acetyl-CoA-carboxylase] ligase [Candidatus Viridilinea halotolerans]|uniref:biotin--[biotin carboxyl-carrier protein] ligase n=1 Tax=Candidatus Viridilinea halotolerans TaxID=2491704 RepID=A0A426TYZ7_9CHLR|nr:MAG: biotin--[acetyl-CoA-carboxylase] ligase [Candidatus Viridilinea halotolerans]
MSNPPLTKRSLQAAIAPAGFVHTVQYHASIGSTMDAARDLLQQQPACCFPALIVSDEQTAGRGRQGRRWLAPPGTALLLSLALRPHWLAPHQGVVLVWLLSVALCEAVEQITPLRSGLKWPNDLLLQVKNSEGEGETIPPPPHPTPNFQQHSTLRLPPHWAKAAGILLEVNLSSERIEWAILGCGINVSAAPPPDTTPYPTTSLAAAGGPVERLTLLAALIERIAAWHERLAAGEHAALFSAWRSRLVTLGHAVQVSTPDGPLNGYASDVTPDGSLLVRDAAGRVHAIATGDVS